MSKYLKMKVKAVTGDKSSGFLVILTDEKEKKLLPVSIGSFEAQAIALALHGKTPPRPLTHDLLKSLCEALGGTLQKVVVTDVKDTTFYAKVFVEQQGETVELDARPSDAIALALRCGAELYAALKIVEFTYDYKDIIAGEGEEEK